MAGPAVFQDTVTLECLSHVKGGTFCSHSPVFFCNPAVIYLEEKIIIGQVHAHVAMSESNDLRACAHNSKLTRIYPPSNCLLPAIILRARMGVFDADRAAFESSCRKVQFRAFVV